MSDRDEREFVEFVLEQGASFVPNVEWPGESYVEIEDWRSYGEYRQRTNLMHIVSPRFTRSGLAMRPLPMNRGPGFYIVQRTGGPSVDFFCPKRWTERGKTMIAAGMLGIYKTYVDAESQDEFDPPEELAVSFRLLARWIRRGATKIDLSSGRSRWACGHAMDEVALGEAALSD